MFITENINRKLLQRLVIRELRALFRRQERAPHNQNEPQNIWEGTYFRVLDQFFEEDNLRPQEAVRNAQDPLTLRNEMLDELRRLRNIMRGDAEGFPPTKKLNNRNKDLFYTILDEMNLHVSLVKQTIFIHKKYGMFEINLNTADVQFSPSTCLRCNLRCLSRWRHICIVRHDNSNDGFCAVRVDDSDAGWMNIGLNGIDLLILSKAIALENNLLPFHVINQLKNRFNCNFIGIPNKAIINDLRNLMLQELNYPTKDIRDYHQLPLNPVHIRVQLLCELRNIFQRSRNRQQITRE